MKSSYPEFVGADESSRLYREVCAAVLFGSCACVVGACSRNSPASRVMKVVLPIGRVGFGYFQLQMHGSFVLLHGPEFFLARAWPVLAEGDDGHTQRRNIRRRGVRFLRRGPVSPGRPKGAQEGCQHGNRRTFRRYRFPVNDRSAAASAGLMQRPACFLPTYEM